VRSVELEPGQRLEGLAKDSSVECTYFVVTGQVWVVLADAARAPLRPPSTQELLELARGWRFIASFGAGDLFSDAYLPLRPTTVGGGLDCVAATKVTLAVLPSDDVAEVMRRERKVAVALTARNLAMRRAYFAHAAESKRLVQDFYLRHGYSFAKTIKVIQLDRCIDCDGCEDACAARYGTARLRRVGPKLGVLSFPLGCRSCVDHRCVHACGFDAISLDAATGEVKIDTRRCVGCTACKTTCPNDVITMVETPYVVEDFPNALPDTDGSGRSNVPGLYLAGESSGAPLIKLAINSGVKAVEDMAKQPSVAPGPAGRVDVAIVGAGPAGLAAALACQEHKLSYLLFDKGTYATTVQGYPRAKLVMAEPAHIPLYGELWLKDTTKEQLVAKWGEIIEKTGLALRSHTEISAVTRLADGTFELSAGAASHRARFVLLAVGTRGSPRKIGVEGETEARVKYALADPDEHRGRHALVVGGGDSAVEAACSLADAGATVTLSYRKESFDRVKARNRTRVDEYAAAAKLTLTLKSTVKKLEAKAVVLKTDAGEKRVPNDIVFAMLGAEPPTKFFEKSGVTILAPGSEGMARLAASRGTRQFANKCDHCADFHGEACVRACPTGALIEVPPDELFFNSASSSHRLFSELPFLVGLDVYFARHRPLWRFILWLLALVAVVGVGLEAFVRAHAPEMSLAHAWWRHSGRTVTVAFASGSGLGLGLGYVGATLMALAALYPVHKRLPWPRHIAQSRAFLAVHVWMGFVGPILMTYHTGFKLDRWPSLAFWAAWLIVFSGILGRYVQSWFRRGVGLAELEVQSLAEERARLFSRWQGARGRTRVFSAVEPLPGAPIRFVALAPAVLLIDRLRVGLLATWLRFVTLRALGTPEMRAAALRNFVDRARADRRRRFADALARSVVFWRRVHLVASVGMFVVASIHIAFGLLYKAN